MRFSKRLFIISIFLLTLASEPALAQRPDYGLKDAAEGAGKNLTRPTEENALPKLVGTAIGSLLSMIAILFFIFMVYGGFLWMTARGDEGQVTKGRETIIAAVIGILIVIGSYGLTRFVMNSVNKTNAGKQGACQTNDDCAVNESCYNHICSPPVECHTASDCPITFICVNGSCESPRTPAAVRCSRDVDCTSGYRCDDGICTPPAFQPNFQQTNPHCTFRACPAGYAFPRDCRFVNRVRVIWPQDGDPCDELTNTECAQRSYCQFNP